MTLANQIAKNTLSNIIGRTLAIVFGVLSVALITRYLGVAQYGGYTTVIAYLQIFGIFADFGLMIVGAQMMSAQPQEESRIFGNLLSFRLLTAAILFALAPLVVLSFPYSREIKIGVAVASFSFFCIALQGIFTSVFQVHLKGSRIALGEAGGRFVLLAATALAIAAHKNIFWIFGAHMIANTLQLAYLYGAARKVLKIALRWNTAIIKDIVNKSWPIGLSIFFNLIYLRADTLILSLVRTQTEVGLYGAPYRILDALNGLPYLFMGFVLPLLSAAWAEKNRERFSRILGRATEALLMLALPIATGGMLLAKPIMLLIAGKEFAASGYLLALLLLALVGVFMAAPYTHAAVAIDAQKTMLWVFGANALISLALYILFIPRFGASAAAGVTVFSEVFAFIGAFLVVRKKISPVLSFAMIGKIILATGILIAAILLARARLTVLPTLGLGALAYGITLLTLRALTPAFVKEMMKRGNPKS